MYIWDDNLIFKALERTRKHEDVNKSRGKENEDAGFMNKRMKKKGK